MHDRWLACVTQLEAEVPTQLYKTWIKPLTFIGYDESDHVLRLGAPNQFKLNWVRNQFGTRISQLAGNIIDPHARVVFEIALPGGEMAATAATDFAVRTSPPQAAGYHPHGSVPAYGDPGTQRPDPGADDELGSEGSDPIDLGPLSPTSSGPASESAGAPITRDPSPGTSRLLRTLDALSQAQLGRTAEGVGNGLGGSPGEARAEFHPLNTPVPRGPSTGGRPQGEGGSSGTAQGGPPGNGPAGPAPGGPRKAGEPPVNDRTKLRHELTFETFVTGKSNQMARAAALQVVERPGTAYNPLFLYGGVGLGKTHLIHAVGNAVLEHNRQARVRYLHAQEYFDEMVRAIQRKNPDDWKRSYHTLDVLLIDDIQFLANKTRTQEEFFYTFEALYASRKQIIITCDTYPKEMSGVEERLISRFDSGLIVAIEPPELEMRVAILLRKAESMGAELPEDVAFFIGRNLRSNVRELEGALRRVMAYADFHNKPLSLESAKTALEDLLALNRRQVSVEVIQKTVADFFKLKVADMYSKRRLAHIVLPRQCAMYLAKELTQKSLPEIGEAFGGRDHTTVLHAVRKIAELRQHDSDLNHSLHVLEQSLRG